MLIHTGFPGIAELQIHLLPGYLLGIHRMMEPETTMEPQPTGSEIIAPEPIL